MRSLRPIAEADIGSSVQAAISIVKIDLSSQTE
jgi:hypothetical protein